MICKHAGACSFSGGGLVDIPAFTMDSFGIALWMNLAPITVGEDIDNGQPVAPTTGMLDDVYIYDRPLTAAEIATLSAP